MLVHLVGRHRRFGELEHRGRRSGATYRTPLNAFRGLPEGSDVVTLALTYGPDVDWLANVRAAGGGRLRLGQEWLTLGPPRELSTEEGLGRMPGLVRRVLPVVRCHDFVELPVLSATPVQR